MGMLFFNIVLSAVLLFILNRVFLQHLVASKNYIPDQLKYFIIKAITLSAITCFFCFFSPINSTKFILSSLTIFIVFHFIEAMIIQKKINMKDSNG